MSNLDRSFRRAGHRIGRALTPPGDGLLPRIPIVLEADPLRLVFVPADLVVDAQCARRVFDFNQNAAETWRGSNMHQKREILDLVCLNRTLSDVSLDTTMRKPFDGLAERLKNENSRSDRI